MDILTLIKNALKEKKVDEKHAERVKKAFNVEKEENVASAVNSFIENILPAIAASVEEAKKAAEEAKKAAISEYEKTHNLKDGKPVGGSGEGSGGGKSKPDTNGLSPELKELIEAQNKQIQELSNAVKESKAIAESAGKKEEAKAKLKEAGLPEKWLDRVNVNSETSIEDQVKSLGEEYTSIKQSIIDGMVSEGGMSVQQPGNDTRTEKDWIELMNGTQASAENNGIADLGIE